jgi:excinuclease ABC subunit C
MKDSFTKIQEAVCKPTPEPQSNAFESADPQNGGDRIESETHPSRSNSELARGQDVIKSAVKSFPTSPGIYRMLDKEGKILYVGKAKNLKNRVTSYTKVNDLNYRIRRMVSNVHNVTFVVTSTESDAIFLEADLIYTLKPPYNVLLKESSPFVSIGLSKHHDFPRIWKHRGPKSDDEYLGPFSSVKSVDDALVNIQKIFQLRTCTDYAFNLRTRPCLQYDIKRCSAPCVNRISREEYQQAVRNSKEFLTGKLVVVKDFLKSEMLKASDEQNYEKAARCRDTIRRLEKLTNIEKAEFGHLVDADIIAIYQQAAASEVNTGEVDATPCHVHFGLTPCVQVLIIRNGLYLGGDAFFLDSYANLNTPSENLSSFLQQFYLNRTPPSHILVSHMPENISALQEALANKYGHPVAIKCPRNKNKWVSQALNNAMQQSQYETARTLDFQDNIQRLASVFSLPKVPERIEIYDNSHNQGTYAYGCMVVTNTTGFDKKSYRKFAVAAHKDDDFSLLGGSDFAMMEEMMTRRFKDASALPDLMIIDGGAGQLSAVLGVLAKYSLQIPMIGVAKGPDRNAGRERFFLPGRAAPISLTEHDPTLHFIQRLRDEAHRFAIGTYRSAHTRSLTKSQLDEIPGIGSVRKRALITALGSVAAVKKASIEDLQQVNGITAAVAKSIYDHFH